MNYLAHLFLANSFEELIVGGLLGDFAKGRVSTQFPPLIRQGIILHRRTDSFTDAHSSVRLSRNRISPLRRRFAGIIIDIGYDHFLARHWQRYSEDSLEEFAARAYDVLLRYQHHYPSRLRDMLPRMVKENWLCGYREFRGLNRTFSGMGRRLTRANHLAGAEEEIASNYAELELDFQTFFPDVIDFTHRERKRLMYSN